MHRRPLSVKGLGVLCSHTQSSMVRPLGPIRRFREGNRKANLLSAPAGNGMVLGPFVGAKFYESLEISRRGEDGCATTEHSVLSRMVSMVKTVVLLPTSGRLTLWRCARQERTTTSSCRSIPTSDCLLPVFH